MAGKLTQTLSVKALVNAAGKAAFARGDAYFLQGRVADLAASDQEAYAKVAGTQTYSVRITCKDGAIDGECDCPVGEGGEFCKHMVATALAVMRGAPPVAATSPAREEEDRIARFLQQAPAGYLAAKLAGLSLRDPALRRELEFTALAGAVRPDMKALRQAVGKALAVREFLDREGMRAFVARARTVPALLRELIAAGKAQTARELAFHALERGFVAYERTDDSNGGFGLVLGEVAGLLVEACAKASAEPRSLAASFYKLLMQDGWGFFDAKALRKALGAAGLAALRERLLAAFDLIPPRGPGEQTHYHDRPADARVLHMLKNLALAQGDDDLLIAALSRDLTSSYRYLEIAEVFKRTGKSDTALSWAEQGYAKFPPARDGRLVDFLVNAYAGCKRHADAQRIALDAFTREPHLDAYRRLLKISGTPRDRSDARQEVIAWLAKRGSRQERWLLIEIHLVEGDVDQALVEARKDGCPDFLWRQIAPACEAGLPRDAIGIYRMLIEQSVRSANNRAYADAAGMIRIVGRLHAGLGSQAEFAAYTEDLRVRHKAKRNFMRELEAAGTTGVQGRKK